MPDSWEKAYSELKEYISNNPQIEIDAKVIAIPGDVRPDFYRLFDVVRVTFLKEKCQSLLIEATHLSNNYNKSVKDLKKSLDLSEIKVPGDLNWLLIDPINGLIRSFYKTFFDLLKGEIDTNTFENEASESISNSFGLLLKLGYERWVALSIINLLTPDKALAISSEDVGELCHDPEWDDKNGFLDKKLPDISETKSPYFGFGESPFMLANIIVNSAGLDRYISIRVDLADATWSSEEVSNKREWLKLRELGKPLEPRGNWPDMVIYVDDKPEYISLVADFGRFCRPDIVIECMEQVDWYQKDVLDKVKQNHDFFKPKLGSYVVSRLPVPEEIIMEISPDIRILTVGYDQSQLAPIIDVLSPTK